MVKLSKIWSHAKRIDGNTVQCNHCDSVLSSKGGSTSAVRNHLFGTHHINVDTIGSSMNSPDLRPFLVPRRPTMTKTKSMQLDQKIAAFIAQDARPISLVDGKGFKRLLEYLEPDYKIKSRAIITSLIKIQYMEAVLKLKCKLQDVAYVVFTTDMWTSVQNIGYICITAHWINTNWELEAAVLQTRNMPERHTGENISIRLANCAEEWRISEDRITATVHDNGSNINCALNMLDNWPDQRCFAHTLQLSIAAGLKVTAIEKMLARARKLAAHFKRSTIAAQALRDKQTALQNTDALHTDRGTHFSEIIIDRPTRWNSTFDMLERLVKLRWAIGAVLSDLKTTDQKVTSTYKITDNNWSLAQDLLVVLKPFKQVTAMLSGQSYPSISSIYPQLYIILNKLDASEPHEHAAVKQCRANITKELRSRYYPDGYSTLNASKAAVLDPRYKLLKFFEEPFRQETLNAIRQELYTSCCQIMQTPRDNEEMEETKYKRSRIDDDIFSDLNSLCASDQASTTSDELAAYMMETPLSPKGDFLKFWCDNTKRYPKLSALARKYLCIPATSVPSESIFSTAGHIVNKKRASLDPDTADILIFLSKNWEMLCIED